MIVKVITVKQVEVPEDMRFLKYPKNLHVLSHVPEPGESIPPIETGEAEIFYIGDEAYTQTDGTELDGIVGYIFKLRSSIHNLRGMLFTEKHKTDSFQSKYLKYETASFWQRLKYLFKGTL